MQPLRRGVPSLVVALLLTALTGHCHGNRTQRQIFPGPKPVCGAGTSCIPLSSCPLLQALVQRPTIDNLRRLQRALCGFNGRDPRVCCPGTETIIATTQPSVPTEPTGPTQCTGSTISSGNGGLLPSKCGQRAFSDKRVTFGEDTILGAFPWMALLGFSSRGSGNTEWGCGGALITSRYVVTAGHCTVAEFIFDRKLSIVRLGEHNIAFSPDCDTKGSGQRCAPAHQDFRPEQIIRHPDFNSRGSVSDDIALIRLNRPAQLNGFVQPICLPAPGESVSSIVGSRQAIVAGWGTTETGSNTQILQSAHLPFVSKARCNRYYKNGLVDKQICFGGDGRRDSCYGDSGGPVMISGTNTPDYILLALVSYGQRRCGVEDIPAVHTDISAYRCWILSQLRV